MSACRPSTAIYVKDESVAMPYLLNRDMIWKRRQGHYSGRDALLLMLIVETEEPIYQGGLRRRDFVKNSTKGDYANGTFCHISETDEKC